MELKIQHILNITEEDIDTELERINPKAGVGLSLRSFRTSKTFLLLSLTSKTITGRPSAHLAVTKSHYNYFLYFYVP